MTFHLVTPEKIATAIVRQIETLFLRGVLRSGERLPAERNLAAGLDVSRPTLREALAELEAHGLIETRPGPGPLSPRRWARPSRRRSSPCSRATGRRTGAGHNPVMLHMIRSMFEVLKAGVLYNRQAMFPGRTFRADLLTQHRPILARDAGAARSGRDPSRLYSARSVRVARNGTPRGDRKVPFRPIADSLSGSAHFEARL